MYRTDYSPPTSVSVKTQNPRFLYRLCTHKLNKWAAVPYGCALGLAAPGRESRCPRAWREGGFLGGARVLPWQSASWGAAPLGWGERPRLPTPLAALCIYCFAKSLHNLIMAIALIFTFSKSIKVSDGWRGEPAPAGGLPGSALSSCFGSACRSRTPVAAETPRLASWGC